jgi:multiple sugar transport system ATP-binding protein
VKKLILTDVEKSFRLPDRNVRALDAVSLEVQSGEFFILLGPSGCGKSTLLNSVAGLEVPEKGEIRLDKSVWFNGATRTLLSARERNVAMVFQSYALYPHMTVEQNIAFPLSVRKTGREEKTRRVKASADMLQISHLLSSRPAELSGGQRQRVAIARALVREPDLFLLDEPLSNLDAQLRSSMRNSLRKLQGKLGITTLYVTHDQIEAMTLGDRIAVMRNGRIEQIGTPDELYTRPANPFVASFIGTPPMNLIPVEARIDERGAVMVFAGREFSCPAESVRPGELRGSVNGILGIRPEHVRICGNNQSGAISVEVTGLERAGRETVLFTRCDKADITLITGNDRRLAGEKLSVFFPEEHLYCFAEGGS